MPRGTTEQPQVIPGTLLALLVMSGSCSLGAEPITQQLALYLYSPSTQAVPDVPSLIHAHCV